MAKYTMSILDILEANANGKELSNLANVLEISQEAIFKNVPMSLITEEYRDKLILGFTLHFMYDEIGLETLPAWKTALAEKVYSNAEYINMIYANLDKQVFSNYKTSKIKRDRADTLKEAIDILKNIDNTVATKENGTVTDTGTASSTENTTSKDKASGTTGEKQSESNIRSGENASTVDFTSENTNVLDGESVTANTGTDTTTRTGTSTVENSRSDTNNSETERKGTTTVTGTSTDSGSDTNNSESTRTPNLTNSSTSHTSDLYSDTPQNGLSGVESGEYLTTARINNNTSSTQSTGNEKTSGSSTTNYGRKNVNESVTSHDGDKDVTTATASSAETSTTTNDLTDTNTLNTTATTTTDNTTTDNRTDKTESSATDKTTITAEITNNKTDSSEGSSESNVVSSAENSNTQTSENAGEVTTVGKTNESHGKNSTGNIDETITKEDYEFNYEVFLKAEPFTKRIYGIFDDLFLGLL